ncbi:MAG: biotin--[acetyl-CoA-carboxylase] ligase [Verrucomicrobia bacterium]|nr:MAG: biotin--[acetyl-CoA-carboxylase] ligase [Verrucomicrobiota bacterium]PYK60068.1 MAG: biotin--[acetyl-CoA-carboxylase] ligase [Verrucomicrobiota bacterium]PYK73196.1 MAG: biotin--[acetyl-CoA-carboxylase] ligase [Verrucomicrobiota bacterium]
MLVADRLNGEKLRAQLGPCTIGREIVVLEETTSTNDVVLQMANGGAPEGIVVFAEHQSAGRGQRGNVWESAPGKGLWFSVLLRPKAAISDPVQLAQRTAQIVATTIQGQFYLSATVKLPNDIYIDDGKVAGVLVEMRAQPKAPHLAVLGIGVNVNQTPHDFSEELRKRATSLAIARRAPIDRSSVAVALLRNLDLFYRAGSL